MVMMLVVPGIGLLVIALVAFLRTPGDSSVSYKGVEFKGPVAMAVLGCFLVGAAAVKRNATPTSDDKNPIGKDQWPALTPAEPSRRSESGRRTTAVPFYGQLQIGGSCQGQHRLTEIWNCDASRTQRVHCQNDMVTVEPCSNGCQQHANGENDECR